jgi:hypothetical protein
MGGYPANSEEKEMAWEREEHKKEAQDDAAKLSVMLMRLPSDLNYLDVEEARDWLKELDPEQIEKNR